MLNTFLAPSHTGTQKSSPRTEKTTPTRTRTTDPMPSGTSPKSSGANPASASPKGVGSRHQMSCPNSLFPDPTIKPQAFSLLSADVPTQSNETTMRYSPTPLQRRTRGTSRRRRAAPRSSKREGCPARNRLSSKIPQRRPSTSAPHLRTQGKSRETQPRSRLPREDHAEYSGGGRDVWIIFW